MTDIVARVKVAVVVALLVAVPLGAKSSRVKGGAAELARTLHVRSGETVLLLGPGAASILKPVSVSAGNRGRIYVGDSDVMVVRHFASGIASRHLRNAEAVRIRTDGRPFKRRLSRVVVVNSFRNFNKNEFWKGLRRSLASGGEIDVVDFAAQEGRGLPESEVRSVLERHGLEPAGLVKLSGGRYLLRFRVGRS